MWRGIYFGVELCSFTAKCLQWWKWSAVWVCTCGYVFSENSFFASLMPGLRNPGTKEPTEQTCSSSPSLSVSYFHRWEINETHFFLLKPKICWSCFSSFSGLRLVMEVKRLKMTVHLGWKRFFKGHFGNMTVAWKVCNPPSVFFITLNFIEVLWVWRIYVCRHQAFHVPFRKNVSLFYGMFRTEKCSEESLHPQYICMWKWYFYTLN